MTELHEEDFQRRMDWRLWRRIMTFVWPHRRFLIPLAFTVTLTAGCEACLNLVMRRIIDVVVVERRIEALWLYGSLYCGLALAIALCAWLFINLGGHISTAVSHDIRRAGFTRLQTLSFAYYDRRPVGWLMARMTSDCDRLGRFVAWGFLQLLWGATLMIAIAGVMLWLDWRLALAVFVVVPLLALTSLRFQRVILKSSRHVRKINSRLTAGFNEGIVGAVTSKALLREDANAREFGEQTEEMYHASVLNALQSALYLPVVLTLGAVGTAIALGMGGHGVLTGGLTIGTLVAFMAYSHQFFGPIQNMARIFADLQVAQASGERIVGLIDTEPKIKDSPEVLRRIEQTAAEPDRPGIAPDGGADTLGRIEFDHVSFTYDGGQTVLDDFNLTVASGERLAVVGPTGGGKTTLISLLCRFYEPTSGRILIDGVDYRERGLRWYQSRMGVVLQTPHLFSGTIRANIRYGRLDATNEEVEWAARVVGADAFIADLADGYDSRVGEEGVNLSTGQKQIVSFARAILADPALMILDEATSSVDTETERMIQRGLERVLHGRTSVIIAHRLSTIRSADRILVVEGGRIVESGSHDALIAQHGHYYTLYTEQFTHEREDRVVAVHETPTEIDVDDNSNPDGNSDPDPDPNGNEDA